MAMIQDNVEFDLTIRKYEVKPHIDEPSEADRKLKEEKTLRNIKVRDVIEEMLRYIWG